MIAPTQPQLLQIALDPGDVVYTPDWVARDMVEYFQPSGRILEPCCGDGVFLKYLPADTLWCEIERGRDFFAWRESVDWIIGNPPYKIFSNWLDHSFEMADDVVYLLPTNKIFQSVKMLKKISRFGWIKSIIAYGRAGDIGFPFGFSIGAFHFRRGYTGATMITMHEGEQR